MAPTLAIDRARLMHTIDEEYDSYKKKGDDLFKSGKYPEARRQYQNCLEVPGFENDPYAKGQLEKCAAALVLRQQAADALRAEKYYETVMVYGKLLEINPDDAITKDQLAAYYEQEGNKLYSQQKYAYAKARYEQALPYSTRQESLRLLIRDCEKQLMPVIPKRTGLKLATGFVAVGAGVYALLLRSDFQTKLSTLNQVNQTTDPSNTGVIAPPEAFQKWSEAYDEADVAKKKNGLYKACLGVAAAATVAELYLLIHKPKNRARALNWRPSSTSWGLAVTLAL
jgi:tetratricopeptide (TPR) repeat protein